MSAEPEIDPYLWDGSGAPEGDVARLERLLGRFAHDPASAAAPAPAVGPARPWLARWRAPLAVLAAAALLLVWWRPFGASGEPGDPVAPGPGYRVQWAKGTTVARAGERIEVTDAEAVMTIGDIGEVEVRAGSVVRVEDVGGGRHGLYLERGSLHATIDAEPRVFQVGSPAGLTVDLGCEYELSVAPDGAVTLAVRTGQVALEHATREVYVPAGARAVSHPDTGPEPPFFDDADDELREAVGRVWSSKGYSKANLDRIVSFRDRDDALPIYVLLFEPAIDESLRGAIFDRFVQVFQKPPAVTRERVLACDPDARQEWLDVIRYRWVRQSKR